jgi:hypothetical protein
VTSPEIVRLAESIELSMNEAFWAVLPRAQKRKLESCRLGGAFITMAPKSASLQRNRVRGLGVEETATEAMVDEIPACSAPAESSGSASTSLRARNPN